MNESNWEINAYWKFVVVRHDHTEIEMQEGVVSKFYNVITVNVQLL